METISSIWLARYVRAICGIVFVVESLLSAFATLRSLDYIMVLSSSPRNIV